MVGGQRGRVGQVGDFLIPWGLHGPLLAGWQAFPLGSRLGGAPLSTFAPCPDRGVFPQVIGDREAAPLSAGVMSALQRKKSTSFHALAPLSLMDLTVEYVLRTRRKQ